ncbi:MAG: hypothetical protein ACRCZS_02300 [Chroococcidiopsis sp.]
MATPLRLQLEILTNGASASVGELRRIREEAARAAAESRQSSASQQQGNTLLGGGIAELAFRYNNVVGALQNLRATAQPVYDALIASNEKLNAQILSSQTNLASSTRLFKGDTEITDPTAKIQASAGALRAAIKQIEIDTQSLVGVTSAQVNELFQITLTNAAALNNQSKQFPDAIAAATSLTKGWAASLKVVGIPLDQARQEINSIIKGQITQDSLLAKNLNITNQQVESWRSQGRLVDELNGRLEVFVAGNAIAARSLEGIGSNILDLSERIARNAGEPLLEPLINSLAEAEKYLKSSEQSISIFFSLLTDEILRQGKTVEEVFAPTGKTLLEIGEDLGPIALYAIKGILSTLAGASQVIAPLTNLLAESVGLLADFAATDLGGVVVQTAAVVLVLTQLQTIIAGLAVAALPTLWGAVVATVTSLGTLYAATMAVATGNTALALSIPAVQTAMAALTGQAIALNLALIPLTAAIGLAVLVRTTNDLADANEALEAYGQQILATADGVLSISTELNKYNKIVKDGGVLTEEQLKRQKQLRASAQAQVEGIQEQIKAQKELTNLNADQARQRDNNIKQLQALAEKVDKAAGGLKIESKLLEDLGTTAELAAKKLEDFNRQIKNEAGGDKAAFEAALKGKIGLIQSEVAQKRLSIDVARAELEAVRDNTKAELDIRNSAKDAIDKLYDGRIAKVKELIEVGQLEIGSAVDELAKIRDDATLEASTRRKAAQQIVSIRKEQLASESAAIAAGQTQIATQQAQQRLGEAKADEESTKLKLAEISKRIEGIKTAEANATSNTERGKLKAEREKEAAEGEKLEAELAARRRKRILEDYDERRNLIKAQNDLGLIDRGTYNQQILLNDIAQNDAALKQQQQALAKLGANDREGREAINAQIAQLQSKRMEIAREYDRADIARQTQYYDQELTSLEAFKNQKLISENEFIQQKAQNRIAQADAELVVANRELERLGTNDIEGRNAINTRINELSNKRLKALEESYSAELVLIKDAQDKAIAIVTQSEQQRTIELQKLVNQRVVRQEDADSERARSQLANRQAELKQAQDFEAALARTANAKRSPEVERAYQQQVRDARSRTLAATLNVIETEGRELERLRNLALKGIEDESVARSRSIDRQLSQVDTVRAARDRAAKSAELSSQRETFALDVATKALERQNSLLSARSGLQRAVFEAQASGEDLELQRVNRAIAIKEQLKSQNLSIQERLQLQREFSALAGSDFVSELELVKRKQAIENQQALTKRQTILFEQAAARSALAIDQQKIDLANQRAVIEARIAELKAKQGILDAQDNARQTALNNKKSIDAAELALKQAQNLAPGRERDRAVADAASKLTTVRNDAQNSDANARQGIDLAEQQASFAQQNTALIVEQVNSQSQIKQLQIDTLATQQQTVLKQLEAAEAAKEYANQLERAAQAAKQGGVQINAGVTVGARAGGGSVGAGRPYIVGENEPELFIPNVSGTILNREQILRNLSNLGGVNLNVADNGSGTSNREVVEAVRSLEQTIQSRPPAAIVANFNAPDDDGVDKLFALQRSALRI